MVGLINEVCSHGMTQCVVFYCFLAYGQWGLTLPYLTSGVGRLLHLPSAEAVSARPNAHPHM